MRTFARLAFGSVLLCAVVVGACEEDTAMVRMRPDGAAADAGDAGLVVLSCGVVVAPTYDSPAFATNAKEELDIAGALGALDARMKAAEGTGASVVATAELRAIYEQGTPSLKSASTSAGQAIVDGYFVAFGDAQGKTWAPELVEGDGGADAGPATTGGKYDAGAYVSLSGVDLRAATNETLLGGALYNHALVVASGPVTEASIDRLVASFGASTKLLGSSREDAGADADRLLARHAAERDNPANTTGAYRRLRLALLSAKTAAGAGAKCSADLDAAVKVFFAEWERTTYASAIYHLNDAASMALRQPPSGEPALRSLGEAIGLVQSFKGIVQDRRKITDVQIDDLLSKMGGASAYQLVTKPSSRAPKLVEAINTIAAIYGWSQADVAGFEQRF